MKEKSFKFSKIGLEEAMDYNKYSIIKSGFVSVVASSSYFYISSIMPLENIVFIAFAINSCRKI